MDKDWSDAETSKHLKAEIDSLKEKLFQTDANLSGRIDDLEEALRFYANSKHYELFVRSHSSMGEYETSHIMDDGGSIARRVLKDE